MQSRARVREEPDGQDHSQVPLASASGRDAELAAIALLCLMFGSAVDEPTDGHVRLVWP
jgi:hypothetical protein